MTCSLCWLHLSLLHTHQRASRLRASPSCEGTCSASIWLNVASCLPPGGMCAHASHHLNPDPGHSMGTGKRFTAAVLRSSEARFLQRHKPVTTKVLPVPKAIIEMVRCQCRGDCPTAQYSCRFKNLSCTVQHWVSEWWGFSGWHIAGQWQWWWWMRMLGDDNYCPWSVMINNYDYSYFSFIQSYKKKFSEDQANMIGY